MSGFIIFINIVLDKWFITKVIGTCRLYDGQFTLKFEFHNIFRKKIGLGLFLDNEIKNKIK